MNHQQIILARRLVSWGTKSSSFHMNSSRNVMTVTSSLPHQHQHQLQPSNNIRDRRRFFSNYNNEYDDDDDNDYHDGMMHRQQTALVVGSSGSLGRCLIEHLSRDLKVRVIGADVIAPSSEDESRLTGGFVVSIRARPHFLTAGRHMLTCSLPSKPRRSCHARGRSMRWSHSASTLQTRPHRQASNS